MRESVAGNKRGKLWARIWEHKYIYLLLLPSIIWVLLICYAPMSGLYMAFVNYMPTGEGFYKDLIHSEFIGLEWFRYFVTSSDFWPLMRNTLAMSFLSLLFSFPAPVILAVCLNEVTGMKKKKFVQTVSYLPYFISWVIASNIFLTLLSANGVVNNILTALGIVSEPVLFFQNGSYFWWIMAIANMWKIMGYNAIIYLAAIVGIGQDQYEAADIDGATRWNKIWYVTLPELKPTIVILLIMAIGGLLNTGFEPQLLMGNSAIMSHSDVLDTYVLRYGLSQGMFSYSSAVGLFKSVISMILLVSANGISKKWSEQALF